MHDQINEHGRSQNRQQINRLVENGKGFLIDQNITHHTTAHLMQCGQQETRDGKNNRGNDVDQEKPDMTGGLTQEHRQQLLTDDIVVIAAFLHID